LTNNLARSALVAGLVLVAALTGRSYVEYALFAATVPRPVEARGALSESERSTIDIFQRVSPSVVQVVGRVGNDPSAMQGEPAGVQSGTGFVWDRAGHIVTNDHVVQGSAAVAVRLASGEVVEADVVGTAPNYDLGVLRLRQTSNLPPAISVGSSNDLKVGQTALAIGNPFGLDQSLTVGVISALKRRLPTSGGREISNMIQTDASINPGNSGGPLLDSAGRLIGVNTAIISPSGTNAGVGFAIPVDVVNRIVPELIRNGHVPTPGIGIIAGNEALATRIGVEGVVVVRTVPGSPAEAAGLRGVDAAAGTLGDVIVGANGKKVARLSDLIEVIEQAGVGSAVELNIRRGNRTVAVSARVADIGRAS
jgi:S1-C subfamily serine protease